MLHPMFYREKKEREIISLVKQSWLFKWKVEAAYTIPAEP